MSKPGETDILLHWYDENKRDLPWRGEVDPYRVWISEIMLQQTRVEAVKGYYAAFLAAFPDVGSLARAELEAVYKVWEGLGYYSRARRLWEAAGEVVASGGFPRTLAGWLALPGVGAYTAGAVCSLCFGEPALAVDGNVLRVMARYRGIRQPIQMPSSRREAERAAEALLDAARPGDFNQAVMDLGAMVCTPRSPKCPQCPWRPKCDAFAQGDAQSLPIRIPRRKRSEEAIEVAVLVFDDAVLVRKRPEEGLLGGWWEFPHGLTSAQRALLGGEAIGEVAPFRHVFTHRIWEVSGKVYRASSRVDLGEAYRWVDREALLALPIPVPMAPFRAAALERL